MSTNITQRVIDLSSDVPLPSTWSLGTLILKKNQILVLFKRKINEENHFSTQKRHAIITGCKPKLYNTIFKEWVYLLLS